MEYFQAMFGVLARTSGPVQHVNISPHDDDKAGVFIALIRLRLCGA